MRDLCPGCGCYPLALEVAEHGECRLCANRQGRGTVTKRTTLCDFCDTRTPAPPSPQRPRCAKHRKLADWRDAAACMPNSEASRKAWRAYNIKWTNSRLSLIPKEPNQ